MVFLSGKELHIKTNISQTSNWPAFSPLAQEKSVPNLSEIYFSNVSDNKKIYLPEEVIDLSRKSAQAFTGKRYVSDTSVQVDFLFSKYRALLETEAPLTMVVTPRVFKPHYRVNELIKPFPVLHKILSTIKRIRPSESYNIKFRCMFRFSIVAFMIKSIVRTYNFGPYGNGDSASFARLEQIIPRRHDENPSLQGIETLLGSLLVDLAEEFEAEIPVKKDTLRQFLSFNISADSLNPILLRDTSRQGYKWIFELSAAKQEILKRHNEVFSIADIFEVEWEGLSSGHETFLNLFAQLHSAIQRVSKNQHVLICIDEADLYLHPQWQREFLSRILKFVPNIIKKNLQIILTTHSPFLVSDLPRENLILLYGAEQKAVQHQEVSLQRTLGANIIDLFAGPFFLDNGTISAFALERIQQAVQIARIESPSPAQLELARKITQLIGDGLIRDTLSKMLDDQTRG